MSSRMTKYYDDEELVSSRYRKNEDLYKEISRSEINNYDIKSNAMVIGENKNEIDIEKIKKILDTKYNEIPKRKSIRLEETEETPSEKEITKEYDINVILEKAKEQKQDNYEEERRKKLRDTQYDILNNLNLLNKSEEIEEKNVSTEEENLKNLINTIALNETINSDSGSPLDILSDLKGSDNTETLDGLKEEVEKRENITDTKIINSFYTASNKIKENDFEDIDDFSESIESKGTFIKVLIALIVIAILVGVAIF